MIKNILKALYSAIPFKIFIFNGVKSVFKLPKSLYQHLHFKGEIRIPIDVEGKESFALYSDGERVENEMYWGGFDSWYEHVSMEYWVKLCKKSEYIFDIGAYHGVYALAAGAANSNAKIFAFEPVEDSHGKLVRNVNLNPFSIHALKCGVSNSDGVAEFYNVGGPAATLIGSLTPDYLQDMTGIVKTKIETRSLRSVMKEFDVPRIDLMKIDVEGHEREVLEGLGDLLKTQQPTILIEVVSDKCAEQIKDVVKDCDYLYFDIDEVHPPVQISEIRKSTYFNLLLCSRKVAQELNLQTFEASSAA